MSGYREDSFDLNAPEPDEPMNPQASGGVEDAFFLGGLFGFLFFFLLDVLSWFTERGGIFSIVSALVSVRSRSAVIDVDESGLRLPSIFMAWLLVLGLCRLFHIQLDVRTRAKALLPVLVIVWGGFAAGDAVTEPIMTRYLSAHGYGRCGAGDWAQGNGKSRVWFVDYVRDGVECRRRVEDR